MTRRSWFRKRGWGLAAGVAATLVICGVYRAGRLQRLDDLGYDLNCRYFSRIKPDPSIVMIDIDDNALDRIGRWPWGRRTLARLIRTLGGLNARAILLDITFPEPQAPGIDHPAWGKDHDVDPPVEIIGEFIVEDARIMHDRELAAAIEQVGHVYVGMHGHTTAPGAQSVNGLRERAIDLLRRRPDVTLSEFEASFGDELPFDVPGFYREVQVTALLDDDFTLGREAIAKALVISLDETDRHLPGAKRIVARRLAEGFLAQSPDGTWPDFHALVLPGRRFDDTDADREDLLRAFRAARAEHVLLLNWTSTPDSLTGRLKRAYDLSMPIGSIAVAARGVGSVVFQPADVGGVVRDVPLLMNYQGRLLPHLALALAVDLLDIDLSRTERSGDSLIFHHRRSGQIWRVQIDDQGTSPVSWHVTGESPVPHGPIADSDIGRVGRRVQARRLEAGATPVENRCCAGFGPHVPVTRVMEIVAIRDAIDHNDKYLGLRLARLVELQHATTPGEFHGYAQLVRERNRLRRQQANTGQVGSVPRPLLPEEMGARAAEHEQDEPEAGTSDETVHDLDAQIGRIEASAMQWFEFVRRQCESDSGAGADTPTECAETAELAPYVSEKARERHRERQMALTHKGNALADNLRSEIEGKVCLVGFTASSVADFLTSPVWPHVPGVMAHANIVNAFLQNRFIRRAPAKANLLLIAISGLALTILASLRGPWFGLGSLVALWVGLSGVSAVAFLTSDYWIASVAACLVSTVVWAAVTVARQLTEERLRRRIISVLGQYTSPTIAARVADQAGGNEFDPQRACVTCLFCDLRDFTGLSERLGPERTREILNPYLSLMSRRLIGADAMVNKFLGDGIFAFFNAPILPREDHAARGCQTAIECFDALTELNRAGDTATRGVKLEMKIGIATGDVAVGDFGTDAKKDYTCIGDAVNLASRFESANTVFGTRIIADGTTRQSAGDAFAWRPLGLIRVVGKTQAVEAHALLGPASEVDETEIAYAESFSLALRHFQAGRWAEALAQFEDCLGARPNDKAALAYRAQVEASLKKTHHPSDWDGALDLPLK